MKLSKRLQTVADMVTPGNVIADIGTDHAHIPIYLCLNGVIDKAFAMDIGKGPIEKATGNIAYFKLQDKIETRISDGLDKLGVNEADTIIISGMGGILITKILEKGLEVARAAKELVLCPHADSDVLRRFLDENGFEIVREYIIFEDGKYYFCLKARYDSSGNTTPVLNCEEYLWYSKYLLDIKAPELKIFLEYDLDKKQSILEGMLANKSGDSDKIAEFRHKIDIIGRALKHYES